MKKSILSLTMITLSLNLIFGQEINLDAPSDQSKEVSVKEDLKNKPTFTFSGSVDAYYRTNLSADYETAPSTSFANLPGFALGMANVIIANEGEKVGFTADLVVGPRGEDATFLSSTLRPFGSSNLVNQLFAYWNVTKSLKLTIGNFNTFLGYEVISPIGNFNYSTSYMFSYGPFSHTGLKVDYTIGNGFSIMAGIFNPTDATEYNPTNKYTGGVQLGYEYGGLTVYLNTLQSKDFSQYDLTAGYNITDKFYVGLNATKASDNFTGIAGYVQFATSDVFKIGLRVENFIDQGVGVIAINEEEESVLNATLSANYKVGNLTLIPEFRIDSYSLNLVPKEEELERSLSSFVLAVVYEF